MVRFVFGVVMFAALSASADGVGDFVWVGRSSSVSSANWDLSSAYWCLLGNPYTTTCKFTNGGNAFFLEKYGGKTIKQKIITLSNSTSSGSAFGVGDLVVSNDTTSYTLNLKATNNRWFGPNGTISGKFEKFGTGTLTLSFIHGSEKDFTSHGGTIKTSVASGAEDYTNSVFGSIAKEGRYIRFLEGSTNSLNCSWPFGAPLACVANTVFSNSTLTAAATADANISLGPISFVNATIQEMEIKNGTMYWTGDVNFECANKKPYVLKTKSGTMVFGKNREYVNLNVPDLTGDASSDVIISNRLGGGTVSTIYGDKTFSRHFRKNGDGTLALTAENSTMDGNIEIAKGKLLIANNNAPSITDNYLSSAIGAVDGSERTVTIKEGVEMEVSGNASFGLLNTPMSWGLEVNGGTLSLGEGQYGFGTLSLNDATINYGNGCPFSVIHYGLISIGKKIGFYGITPYELPVKGTENYLTLGYNLEGAVIDYKPISTGSIFTNLTSTVEFEVANITGDDEVDVTIGLPIRDMVNMCYPDYDASKPQYVNDPWKNYRFHCGIQKTGKGTLRLDGNCTYTDATTVKQGGLVVNGSIAYSSELKMETGTSLSGKGAVPALKMAADVTLLVDAGDESGTYMSATSLASEGKVTLSVANPPAEISEGYSHPILRIGSKPSSVDISQWQLVAAGGGSTPKGLTLAYDGSTGILSLSYAATGSRVIVR